VLFIFSKPYFRIVHLLLAYALVLEMVFME
jgi:hypothetical protein